MKPPLAIVIDDRTPWSALLGILRTAIPDALRDMLRGPASILTVDPRRQVEPGTRRALLPVDVHLDPACALSLRLAVPASGRADLAHAVVLAVAERTPFEAAEILAHAAEQPAGRADGMREYLIHLVPRSLVVGALATAGVGRRQVRRVLLGNRIGATREIDLQYALFPQRRPLRLLALLPLLVILGSLAWLGQGEFASHRRMAEALDAEIRSSLDRLRQISARLAELKQQNVGLSEIRTALAASPSAFLMLSAVRQALPTGTALQRIDLHAGELRLWIKSEGALRDLAAFESDWTTAIEGAITTDPASGRELATLLLRARPGGV